MVSAMSTPLHDKLMAIFDENKISVGKTDHYELIDRVGSGRYGDVFRAINVTNNDKVAVKVLKPVRYEKVVREVRVLQSLANGSNVIALADVLVNDGIPALVFPFVSKDTLKILGSHLKEADIHYYLYQLLLAIDFTHRNNIIHRDIKPSNVVIDSKNRILRLVDWGLAEFHSKDNSYSVTVASRHYKSPELLCNNTRYDYSLDMWSFGCILAGLLFKKDPFFVGCDNLDQLMAICKVLGSECLLKYVKKHKLKTQTLGSLMNDKLIPKKSWNEFAAKGHQLSRNNITLDLIDKLLTFDPKHRLTSDEALTHPFFDSVKAIKIV